MWFSQLLFKIDSWNFQWHDNPMTFAHCTYNLYIIFICLFVIKISCFLVLHFLYFSQLNICSLDFTTSGCCHPCFYCLSIVYIRKTTNNAYILIVLLYEEESFLYVKPSITLEHIEFSISVKLYISNRMVSGYFLF